MRVDVDGNPLQVLFNYRYSENEEKRALIREVECVIRHYPGEENEFFPSIITGVAKCSAKDNFDKRKGRLLAWKRAMDNGLFFKDQKRQLWKWFLKNCKLPKNNNT